MRKGLAVLLVLVLFAIGNTLNLIFPHRNFYFNQSWLLVMLVLELAVNKMIGCRIGHIKNTINIEQEPSALGAIRKVERAEHSHCFILIECIVVPLYMSATLVLGCAENSWTGYYGVILGTLVFVLGVAAYYRYVIFAIFVYDLRHTKIKKYNFYMPALTEWFVQIADTLSFIDKWFFILGLMYTTLYAVIMPAGIVDFSNGFTVASANNLLFYVTWCGVFVFFILAFPIFTILFRSFLKHVILKCKRESIRQLEMHIHLFDSRNNVSDLSLIEKYVSLIKTINESSDYPLRYKRTIFDGLYTILLTAGTFVSPYLSLVEHFFLKGVP